MEPLLTLKFMADYRSLLSIYIAGIAGMSECSWRLHPSHAPASCREVNLPSNSEASRRNIPPTTEYVAPHPAPWLPAIVVLDAYLSSSFSPLTLRTPDAIPQWPGSRSVGESVARPSTCTD